MPPMLCAIRLAAERRYWHNREKTVIALDQSALNFSSFVLPDDKDCDCVTLAIGRDGEARIVVHGRGGNILKILARRKGTSASGEDAEEWVLEKTIRLKCLAYRWYHYATSMRMQAWCKSGCQWPR
ncbi:hypothetical protein HU200_016061 [Digitaria exilis]|uniref:Uncharacterized protein n=1 Tax=Digitaria exilis TaxID=1010633 RepID=A0A835KJ30_9POAL|nr:hypothetical protein HU200_016061 [Digitaria exilis]